MTQLASDDRAATVHAMEIRDFTDADWHQVWPIVRDVVQARDTYTYDPAMTSLQAKAIWVEQPPGHTGRGGAGRRGTRHCQDGAQQAGSWFPRFHSELHGRAAGPRPGNRHRAVRVRPGMGQVRGLRGHAVQRRRRDEPVSRRDLRAAGLHHRRNRPRSPSSTPTAAGSACTSCTASSEVGAAACDLAASDALMSTSASAQFLCTAG